MSLDEHDAGELDDWVKADPVGFAEDVLGIHLWSKQREIIESVRDNTRTAVRSSRGVGKTTVAAASVLWFLAAFGPECLVVTTAPTWDGVKDLLWREIRSAYQRSRGFFGEGRLTETRLEFGEKWYAVGRSTNRATNFQGYHSDNVLFVVDEASGVAEQIFEAAEGFLTAANARVLLIGNPNHVGGHFHTAFHDGAELYSRIHMGTFDTPGFTGEKVPADLLRSLPTRDWVEDMKLLYRVDDDEEQGGSGIKLNPVYEVHVLGQFPSQGSHAVVPMFEVENAQARTIPLPGFEFAPDLTDEQLDELSSTWPTVIACDVARFGVDETVICLRQGNRIRIVEVIQGQDTMQTAGMLVHYARANIHPLHGKPVIALDDGGVGGGVTDRLRELARDDPDNNTFRVVGFNGSNAAADVNKNKYPNARSELWFEFAEDWLPMLDLDDDKTLLADLCAPEYVMNSKGQRVVEPKADTKKRLGRRSPDRADAVMIAFSRPVSAGWSQVAPSGPVTPGGSKWTGMGGRSGGSRWR